MNENADSYSFSRALAWKRFAEHLSGCPNGYVLALCRTGASPDAKNALQKSLAALGYGFDAVTYLALETSAGKLLDSAALFNAVESIDPGILIILDEFSCSLCEQTYRVQVPTFTALHVFGRETRTLCQMESLLSSTEGKQKIWAALKTLPIRE